MAPTAPPAGRDPIVHVAPTNGPAALTEPMPCCGRTPFAAVQECQDDSVTIDPAAVTCTGNPNP